ncbi:MAG: DNA-directed RNA polymerase [Methanobacteriota archaeon]|nr:MAG: DNA-directed RNA polymerase [Euryarchaeota archaeon]
MYYVVKAKEKLRVPPQFFRREKNEAIKDVVKEHYARKVSKDFGYVISVLDAKAVGKGLVAPGDPNIYYDAEYSLLTFNLEINEVVLGVVRETIDFGAFVNIGPFEALLHISQISKEKFTHDKKSRVLHNRDKSKTLKKGDVIVAKISSVSMKDNVTDVKIGLTTRDVGLGKLDWLVEKKAKKGGKKK